MAHAHQIDNTETFLRKGQLKNTSQQNANIVRSASDRNRSPPSRLLQGHAIRDNGIDGVPAARGSPPIAGRQQTDRAFVPNIVVGVVLEHVVAQNGDCALGALREHDPECVQVAFQPRKFRLLFKADIVSSKGVAFNPSTAAQLG